MKGTTCCVSSIDADEEKPGQEQNKAKSCPGSMWLEILGQEKENHGNESSIGVVQVPRDLESVLRIADGICWGV